MTGPVVQRRVDVAAETQLTIDLAAVGHNTRVLAAHAAGHLMAVVKADGYGHGAAGVARTALAHGATWLGVTSMGEALALREAGLSAPVLSWLNPVESDFATATSWDIDLAVPSLEHLAAVAAAPGRARVHLHIDAGMARDGIAPALWNRLCRAARLAEMRGEVEVVGVMGHLGCADDPADACNATGRTRFSWAIEVAHAVGLRPSERHLAATAATLADPRSHHTMSRVGAGLYGIGYGLDHHLRDAHGQGDPDGGLLPALTLTAPLVQVRRVHAGTAVGYGHTYRTTTPTYLGLVPLGYGDGIPRVTGDRAEVLVAGRRRPVVGRVSMDQLVVDLGTSPVEPGTRVTVFGPGAAGEPTVAEWAAWADTIEHEILTGLGSRVARRTLAPAHLRSLT